MRTYLKTVEPTDYEGLSVTVKNLEAVRGKLSDWGIRCDIGHPHRFWEYGLAIDALQSTLPEVRGSTVLDVGAGWSPLGPTLVWCYDVQVVELDADSSAGESRKTLNSVFAAYGAPPIHWRHGFVEDLERLPGQYDAVFCVSVLEHVDRRYEPNAWRNLAAKVKPGGLLYITVDCVPSGNSGHYKFDNLRHTNYTTELLQERVASLVGECGMKPLGKLEDLRYAGDQVYDYSFACVGMEKQR